MVHDLARVDLTDLDTFAAGFPHDIFRLHREQAPVWWHEPTAHTPDGEGFWSVATYDEVRQVLNDPLTYSSETGGDRPYGGTIIQDLPVAGIVLNMMDDPRHARIRRLVTRGLTPAAVRDLERELRGRMRRLVESVGDDCDFLVDVAAELPMQAICLLLGVPEADRHLLFDAVEHIFDIPDESDFLSMTPEREAAVGVLYEYGAALIDEKRANPGPDMLSTVIHAELLDADPPRLSDDELSAFFSLVFSAGAETTRNAIAGAMLAFLEWPDQLDLLRSERVAMETAVEEILRWTTPSPSKRRTATTACKLGGARISPGQKVVVWEGSANRDPRRFDQPDTFLLQRDPNPHLAFGHGAHFCLDAHLARLEIRVALEEVLRAIDSFTLAAPAQWTRSNRHTGIRHLPLRLHKATTTSGSATGV
jgi:cytochrome P450